MRGNEQDSYAQKRPANQAREERIKRIAELNDQCRAGTGEHLLTITPGIRALGSFAVVAILGAMRSFDQFTDDNDPHGERDFGAFEYCADTVFWKFDYYDKALEYGSPDPADPAVTQRVLTVMLASEY
jgi:hypothetical protein